MKQFFCELLFICAAANPGAQPIDELTYGTVLYEYYQENYDAALLTTVVAQSQNRVGDQTVKFDLAKGSFAFASGMYGYANEIFSSVPAGELEPLDEMRLAFHLSREFHRRQAWTELDEQLTKIDLGKSWLGKQRVHPEVEFMRAEAAVNRGEYAQAEGLYELMEAQHPLRAYGLFNLGVAYRQAGQQVDAIRTFRALSEMPSYSEEAFDLSQRAKLALALLARQEQNTTDAEAVLQELPSEGRYQDIAMAAYAGLAMDNEDYELAARIWMTLKEQAFWTPSTATARLGFPLSLEKLAGQGERASTEMALVHYQKAEESFTNRLVSLTSMTLQAEDPAWVRRLLEVFAVPSQGGLADPAHQQKMQALMQEWRAQLGPTDWLEWLATDNVHQALVQWRELNGMQDWLGHMPNRLAAFEEVAQEQRVRGEQANQLLYADGLLERKAGIETKIVALQQALNEAAQAPPEMSSQWMYPLATPAERELLAGLDAKRTLIGHMPEAEQSRWLDRVNRLQGVVFYQIANDLAQRVRSLRKAHGELATLVDASQSSVQRVRVAEENFVAGVGTDFQAFVDRAAVIANQVDDARVAREELLAQEIRGRMQDEMRQVEQYLLVTRIAIARATDHLALAGDTP